MANASVAAMVSGPMLSVLEAPAAGADARVISVGICPTFFSLIEIQHSAPRLVLEIFRDQMVVAAERTFCFQMSRNMKRFHDVREGAPALDPSGGCIFDEGSKAHRD
jgi:hypothetical protein